TQQAVAFVFDRVTGKPVWPIEERPVPASDVPGEQAWPTQPFPTKPPPFTEQGVTLEDAFDLTPELKAAAQKELQKYRIGPLFTPPSLQGTVQRPGIIGGANWGGAAFDPRSGLLFVKTTNQANIGRVGKPDRASDNPRAAAPHALDSSTGAELWRQALARRANGTPMTYRSAAGRQFVVIATGAGEDAALIAFSLNPRAATGRSG